MDWSETIYSGLYIWLLAKLSSVIQIHVLRGLYVYTSTQPRKRKMILIVVMINFYCHFPLLT